MSAFFPPEKTGRREVADSIRAALSRTAGLGRATGTHAALVEILEQVDAAHHEGLLIIDEGGEIVWCSDAACRLLRLPADEVRGRPCLGPAWQGVHVDGAPVSADERPALRAIATGTPVTNFMMGIVDGEGREAWLSVNATPTDWEGHPIAISSFSDITNQIMQRRDFEATMKQINRTLVQPDLPASGRVYFAARFRSVGPTRLMGGDCHGAHRLAPDRYCFFIGDVCGHGVEAAGLSARARHTFRSAGSILDDPSEVLHHLHSTIEAAQPDIYMTAIFGYIDVADRITVRFASGGHPLPLHFANGRARAVGEAGPILGMVPNRRRPVTTLEVEAGEHLLLYTDGLTSTRAREIEGAELVASLPPKLLTDVLADVALGLADQVDRSESDDDATVLAIGFH